MKTKKTNFDSVDLENFEKFFADLYANTHGSISSETKQLFSREADRINEASTSSPTNGQSILNQNITTDEIRTALTSLNNGKSSGDDLICNEILKALSNTHLELLCLLYNKCLTNGEYPWNNSIISPLHKKGCKSDPDNYRAVAVSSTIGKLFSTILLERILKFKKTDCPDPINQLGFSKGAQTYDHILTLNTIISKYKKLKTPVFAVFVDFKKAFDSVCREALFFKLASIGVSGKMFKTIKNMYENSTGQIKLSGHVSNKFDINKGTEQGHPLSPDLFKIYIKDLSDLLKGGNCPKLLNQLISHLLWADDLILLALDSETLQNQLNLLAAYCKEWGVEINIAKTKLVRFNSKFDGRAATRFNLGNEIVKETDSYCYLGIEIHKSGSFTLARSELKKKALRALYGLKSTVNKTKISFRALTTLFDSLIKPIVLYGAPIVTPTMSIIKTLCSNSHTSRNRSSILKKLSNTEFEKVHLHFLKWALGVNRKASNIGTWGETGRYPLVYEAARLTLKYVKRLKDLKNDSLVKLAYIEQVNLDLDWHRGVENLLKQDPCYSVDHVTAHHIRTSNQSTQHSSQYGSSQKPKTFSKPERENFLIHNGFKKRLPSQRVKPSNSKAFTIHTIMKLLKTHFKGHWLAGVRSSSKLEFYAKTKGDFGKESYLDNVKKFYDRVNFTRLRISAHRLEIELGRRKETPREQRTCTWCDLTMSSDAIEDERHVLEQCDLYSKLRQDLISKISQFLVTSKNRTPTIEDILYLKVHHNQSAPTTQSSDITHSQVHLDRLVCRFINKLLRHRNSFLESLDKNAQQNLKTKHPSAKYPIL